MAEELAKIEKPSVEEFKQGRKLFYIPLVYTHEEPAKDYLEKVQKYWLQVEKQLNDLEQKLGRANRVYHELTSSGGEKGIKILEKLNEHSYHIVKRQVDRGAQFEALEDSDILTKCLDWSRCLSTGLQNKEVFTTIYDHYTQSNQKRNDFITKRIDETLHPDEIGILFMREGHNIQFPHDIELFYVTPPALDEINRWLRSRETPVPQEPGDTTASEKNDVEETSQNEN